MSRKLKMETQKSKKVTKKVQNNVTAKAATEIAL